MEDLDSQQEINKYRKFKKVDGATYRKVNQFLRKRTYITAREWALARLCTDFRTSGGAEMTFIGKHLPELVPFMEDTYTPQAVNQARNAFKRKVRKSSATFFYGAMCGFFTTDELDDLLFEASEVARFLLEVEGTTLDIDEEIDIEDRITKVMRGVGEAAKTLLKTRSDEETIKDQPEGTGQSPTALENGTMAPGSSDIQADAGTPDTLIMTTVPDPSRPENLMATAVRPTTDEETSDRPFSPGENQQLPDDNGIRGKDAPVHTRREKKRKSSEIGSFQTDNTGPDREDS
jgi:Family of unknown function (DUF5806)